MCRNWCRRSAKQLRHQVVQRRAMVASFIESNNPQSDDEFLSNCGLPRDLRTIQVALAVRRAIARFGRVPSLYVRAEHRFCDLEALPNWSKRIDAYFDSARFCRLLEIEVGKNDFQKVLEDVPDPESASDLTVGRFTSEIVAYLVVHSEGGKGARNP